MKILNLHGVPLSVLRSYPCTSVTHQKQYLMVCSAVFGVLTNKPCFPLFESLMALEILNAVSVAECAQASGNGFGSMESG